ncbi:MAG: adenylate/guanylate cyclase domain-containing protein [Saprospirales bacterium]|nr:adenylate/guanylate cyclase domain-containing protein [Saprospirales bacterium]
MKLYHIGITFLLCILVKVLNPYILEATQLNYFDLLQRNHEENKSEQIILLDIDEKSIKKNGRWPWDRDVLAKEINKLPDNNLIALNVLLSERGRGNKDVFLAEAFVRKPIVAATQVIDDYDLEPKMHIGTTTLGPRDAIDFVKDYKGILTPVPELAQFINGFGALAAEPSIDGVVREVPIIVGARGKIFPSFALETIRVAVGDISYQIKTTETGIEWVRIPAYKPIITSDNGAVYNSYWNKFQRASISDLGDLWIPEGSIVIIGPTFAGSNTISTPVGAMFPHEVQANLIETIVKNTVITRPDYFALLELLTMILMGGLFVLLLRKTPMWFSGLVFLALATGSVIGSGYLFNTYYMLFSPVMILLGSILIFGHTAFIEFYRQFKLRQQIKKQFETYLDPRQVALLQKNPELLKLGGERKEMTFLFMDICGFTPISEHYKNNDDPEGLVELVNEFLNKMSNIILDNGGTIDKYMGDCIMAFWNAPLPCENHAELAVKSSIEIEKEVNELKRIYKERNLPDISVGTGINSGDCIVGNMGSESRFDYSVIGDAVNLAARLEATAARGDYIDYKTIVSEYTVSQLPDTYNKKSIGTIKVKGKEEEIKIYSVS